MFFAMGFLIGSIYAPWYTIESDLGDRDEYSDYVVNHGADEPVRDWAYYDDTEVGKFYLGFVDVIYTAVGIAGLTFLLMLMSGFQRYRSDGFEKLIMLLIIISILVSFGGAAYYSTAHVDAYNEDWEDPPTSDGPWESFQGDGDLGDWYPNWGFFLFIMGGIASVLALLAFRSASKMDRALTRTPRRGYDERRSRPRPDDRRDHRRDERDYRDDRRRDDRHYRDDPRDGPRDEYRDDRGYDDRRLDDRNHDRRDEPERRERRSDDRDFDRGFDERDRDPRDEMGHGRGDDRGPERSDDKKWYDEPEREHEPERHELPPKHEIRR